VLGLEAAGAKDKEVEQRNRGVDEFNVRFQYVNGNTALIRNNFEVFFAEFDGKTQAGPMTPVIVGDMLLLARRAPGAGPAVVQGCWLDWEAIRSELLATIADLLPESDLALAQSAEADASRMLASLPARLLPGALPAAAGSGLSPVQMALVVAWAAMVLAAAAVAVLLGGVITLSERRASFVSAVTHELRTPLTTFRMYSEMLADGMVPGEEARRGYLQTLRVEADRLTHLVENVLAYARLERGGLGNRIQQVDAGELLAQITGRAAERARQCGVELLVESPPEARQPQVLADPSAVEQILFNLVDNACKYAANSANAPLEISARVEGNFWRLRVRDRGPGIAAEVRARLFQPFSKSAHDAAQSAPGVGLGLALCRRLARDMHGELRLETPPGGGAAFVLSLPARGAA
jgi:signal transduction histidine kinase